MGTEKEREAFENLWLAGGGNFDNFIFSEDQGKYAAIENSNLTDKQKEMALYVVNNAYLFFVGGFKQAAKAKAVPKINGSIQEHELAISEIKAEIEEGYDLCQDSYLLDVLVERGIDIGKIQAVSEGFVLLEKKGLRDTYYWDGCEYVVDHPSEYEMELERGEIVTLEKWQRTKETNVYCANIFSDEDNFELVQFDSLEEAEKAVAANKTIIEAQEQSHD